MVQGGIEVGALLQVFLGITGVFLSLMSTLALAGRATVAEMAEAAITEKRLKFMAVTLDDSVGLLAFSGREANLTPRVIAQKFIAALASISAIDRGLQACVYGRLMNFRSEGASMARVCRVLPSLPVCGSRSSTTMALLIWLAINRNLPLGLRANSRG